MLLTRFMEKPSIDFVHTKYRDSTWGVDVLIKFLPMFLKSICQRSLNFGQKWHFPAITLVCLTHSERRPQNIFSLEEITSILSSNWQHKFLYFHYKSVKLDVLFRQTKIWTFCHPFQSKKGADLHRFTGTNCSTLTHSERRPQHIYSQEEINLYCIIKLATEISLFLLQISKTWCFV